MATAPPRARRLDLAVIADAHLGARRSRPEELLRYLESIDPKRLVICGDLIDLDAARRGGFREVHLAVVNHLLALAAQGTRVYYLSGNHDAGVRRFGNLALGNLHLRDELELRLDGRSYLLMHGDRLDAAVRFHLGADRVGDWAYRVVSWAHRVVDRTRWRFGRAPYSLARELRRRPDEVAPYLEAFQRVAARLAATRGCDAVICGHTQRPEIAEHDVNGTSVTYLNPGDWLHGLTALEYRFGRWRVERYDARDRLPPSRRLRVDAQAPDIASDASTLLARILEHGPTRA